MKKLLVLLAVTLASPLLAQTSCGSAFPAWMQCNNSTQTLFIPNLALTGGVTYPAGEYIVTISSSGVLTYTAFTPDPGPQGPIGPSGPQGPAGVSAPTPYFGHVNFPVQTIAPFSKSVGQGYVLPIPLTDGDIHITLTEGQNLVDGLSVDGFFFRSNIVTVFLHNNTPNPITLPTSIRYTVMVTPIQ